MKETDTHEVPSHVVQRRAQWRTDHGDGRRGTQSALVHPPPPPAGRRHGRPQHRRAGHPTQRAVRRRARHRQRRSGLCRKETEGVPEEARGNRGGARRCRHRRRIGTGNLPRRPAGAGRSRRGDGHRRHQGGRRCRDKARHRPAGPPADDGVPPLLDRRQSV